jgi:hypothetical protein
MMNIVIKLRSGVVWTDQGRGSRAYGSPQTGHMAGTCWS